MDVEKYLKDSFSRQFQICYGKKLNNTQAKVYMDFCLGKEQSSEKVAEICQVDGLSEKFVNRVEGRKFFAGIFGFNPSDLQLDVYIAYQLKTIPDIEVIWEINKSKKKQTDKVEQEPANG